MNSANGTNDKRVYRKQPAITDDQIDTIVKEGFKFFKDGRQLDSWQSVVNNMRFIYINTTDDKKKLPLGLKKLRMAFNAIIAAIFDSNCDELMDWHTKKERMYSFFELLKIWLAHNSIRNCPSISDVDKTKKRKRKDADAVAVASSKRQNDGTDGRHTAAGSDTSDTDDDVPDYSHMTPPMTPGGSDYPTPDGSDDEVIVKEEPIDRPYIPNNETLSVKRTNIQSVVELGHTVYKEGDHDVIVINDEEGEAEDEEDEAEDEEDEEDEDDDEDDEDDDDPTTI